MSDTYRAAVSPTLSLCHPRHCEAETVGEGPLWTMRGQCCRPPGLTLGDLIVARPVAGGPIVAESGNGEDDQASRNRRRFSGRG